MKSLILVGLIDELHKIKILNGKKSHTVASRHRCKLVRRGSEH